MPDPIPELKPMPGFSLRNTYNINLNKKILLHFGSLTERKGTLEILDAVDFLNNETITRIAVLLIGNTDSKMEKDILSRKSSILSKYPTAKIIFINKFVSEEMMKSCFDQSDFILMPYKNIESSSGILGHAIAAGKPVIAVGRGLIAEIVKKYNTGYLLPDPNSKEIAKSMKECLLNRNSYKRNKEYAKEHSLERFASVLLNERSK